MLHDACDDDDDGRQLIDALKTRDRVIRDDHLLKLHARVRYDGLVRSVLAVPEGDDRSCAVIRAFIAWDKTRLLSDPAVVLALLRCRVRLEMWQFVKAVEIDLAGLQQVCSRSWPGSCWPADLPSSGFAATSSYLKGFLH